MEKNITSKFYTVLSELLVIFFFATLAFLVVQLIKIDRAIALSSPGATIHMDVLIPWIHMCITFLLFFLGITEFQKSSIFKKSWVITLGFWNFYIWYIALSVFKIIPSKNVSIDTLVIGPILSIVVFSISYFALYMMQYSKKKKLSPRIIPDEVPRRVPRW